MREKREKLEYIGMKVTPAERSFIINRARQEGMSVSQYIRYAVLIEAATAGKEEVWQQMPKKLPNLVLDWAKVKAEKRK